jgi:hypothetical protein
MLSGTYLFPVKHYLGKFTVIEMLLVAAAGWAAIVVPVAVELYPELAVHRIYDVAFLPIMAKAVEGMKVSAK